eukprot:539934_1
MSTISFRSFYSIDWINFNHVPKKESTSLSLLVFKHEYLIFTGLLFQISIGTMWTYGNIIPYIASYLTYYGDTSNGKTYTDYYNEANWLFFLMFLMATIGCIIGGKIEIQFGPKIAITISSLLVSLGFGLTYFTLKSNIIYLIYLSYGICFGFGIGFGYPLISIVAMRYFPDTKGRVCGIISGVFGGSPLLWDYIQTYIVNPSGMSIDPNTGYSKDENIVNRIPYMFGYIGIICACLQIITIIFVSNPEWYQCQSKILDIPSGNESKISLQQSQYDANSLTLSETIQTFMFWILWIDFLLFTFVLMFIASEWKVIAINFLLINNDKLLSIIGSISSLFNGFGRFIWGIIYDYNKSFPMSMGLLASTVTICLVLLCFVSGEYQFFIVICIIYCCIGCHFAFLPPCIADTFGAKHTASIVGLFVWTDAPTALLVVLCTQFYKTAFGGWIGYILFVAACSFASLILALVFYIKIRNTKLNINATKSMGIIAK